MEGPAGHAVERRQMLSQPVEINKAIDGAQRVVRRNMVVQAELVKQTLVHYQPIAHHRRSLPIHPYPSESAAISRHNSRVFQRYLPSTDIAGASEARKKQYGERHVSSFLRTVN